MAGTKPARPSVFTDWWEIYLLESANTAEGHVDLHADVSEHFLDPDQLVELERRLAGAFHWRSSDESAQSSLPKASTTPPK